MLQLEQYKDEQFATMGGANDRRHQLNPRFVEEDDEFTIKEMQFQHKEVRLDAQGSFALSLDGC